MEDLPKPRIRVALRKASAMGRALINHYRDDGESGGWFPARDKASGCFNRLVRYTSFYEGKKEEKMLILIPDPLLYGKVGTYRYDLRSAAQYLADQGI